MCAVLSRAATEPDQDLMPYGDLRVLSHFAGLWRQALAPLDQLAAIWNMFKKSSPSIILQTLE